MITSDTCHHEEGNTTLGGPLKFLESSYSAPEKKKNLLCPYKVWCGKLPALNGFQRIRGFCSRPRLQASSSASWALYCLGEVCNGKKCQVAYLVSPCGTDTV